MIDTVDRDTLLSSLDLLSVVLGRAIELHRRRIDR